VGLLHPFGILVAASVVAGCWHFDWVVYAVNDASVDVIVRVEYKGGMRDIVLPAAMQGIVIVLPDARPPAVVSLLDPATCEVRASADLPTQAAVAYFNDGATRGTIELYVNPKNVEGTESAADTRCASR
jgi:hypothetical protein